MKESRSAEVNRALTERRALMNRRILIGRILLGVWMLTAVVNLLLLYGSNLLRLPLSSTSADLLMMLSILNPDSPAAVAALLGALLIPAVMAAGIVFWKHERAGLLRMLLFLLLWADVVLGLAAYFWNPAVLFGESDKQTVLAVVNLVLHVLLVWHISRARSAVVSLETLPEAEIEGDPFEEFRKNR